MDYTVELAKMFKDRENIEQEYAIKGAVIQVNPLKVAILDNNVILDSNNSYICKSLKEIKGDITLDNIPTIGSVTTTFTISNTINIGDKVLCIPMANGQMYAIVDVLEVV